MGLVIDGQKGRLGLVTQATFEDFKRQTQTRAVISTEESVASQALLAATPVKLSLFTDNRVANNATPDYTNNQITIVEAGVYTVQFTASGSFSAANTTLITHIVVNADPRQEPGAHRKVSANDTGNWTTGEVPINGEVALAPGDVISVQVEADNAGNLTLVDALLTVKRKSD